MVLVRNNIIPSKTYMKIVKLRDWHNNSLLNSFTIAWLTGWDFTDNSLNKSMKKTWYSRKKLLNCIRKVYKI